MLSSIKKEPLSPPLAARQVASVSPSVREEAPSQTTSRPSSSLRQRKYKQSLGKSKLQTYRSLQDLIKRDPEPETSTEKQIFDLDAFDDENEKENCNQNTKGPKSSFQRLSPERPETVPVQRRESPRKKYFSRVKGIKQAKEEVNALNRIKMIRQMQY